MCAHVSEGAAGVLRVCACTVHLHGEGEGSLSEGLTGKSCEHSVSWGIPGVSILGCFFTG